MQGSGTGASCDSAIPLIPLDPCKPDTSVWLGPPPNRSYEFTPSYSERRSTRTRRWSWLRQVAIERMEAGDPAFWKMLLDRVWSARVELLAESDSVVEFRWTLKSDSK